MRVSVVIPLYNKREQILRAIASVLRQSCPAFELIIVDDGSTDGGADVARSIADHRIQLLAQPNGGVARARNVGVAHARADWVAFLDADDEYSPDFLRWVCGFIDEHKHDRLSIVGTNYYIGDQSRTALPTTMGSGIYDYFQLFRGQCSPNHSSTTVANVQKLREVNGFPEGVKQFEDWITWFKLAFVGRFGFISMPLGRYHCVAGSASRAPRAAVDFYHDAVLVPRTLAQYIRKYSLPATSRRDAWGCVNEFALHTAGLLASAGEKRLALKMLRSLHVRYLTRKRAGHWEYLLLHLIVPQWMKWVYRYGRSQRG